MGKRALISIFVITTLVIFPFLTFGGSDLDADDTSIENAAVIEYKGDYAKYKNLIGMDLENQAISYLMITLDDGFTVVSSDITDLSHSDGYKGTYGVNWGESNILKISCTFKITVKAVKEGATLEFYGNKFVSGAGYMEYQDALKNHKFAASEQITFSGNMNREIHGDKITNIHKGNENGVLRESEKMTFHELEDFSGSFELEGKRYVLERHHKLNTTTDGKYEYKTGINEVKPGDMCTIFYSCRGDINMSLGIKINNDDKEVNVDNDGIKKDLEKPSTQDQEVHFEDEEEIKKSLSEENLLKTLSLSEELRGQTKEKIESAISANGGSYSYEISYFDKIADEIDKDAGGNNSSNDMTIWIIVGIVVVLIIVGILVWYFKFRTA